jgi:hypothetical protein
MMPQEMPHDDEMQDVDMIKQVLQKIVDEMNGLEANRIHPKMAAVKVDAVMPKDDSKMDGEPEPDADDQNLDPAILSQLMDKAGHADDSGALPEDHESDLPPEIAAAVQKKKGLMK